jgi:nicotinate-nucleotide--dimethylbenzimidazole phosphoribosyltransferase
MKFASFEALTAACRDLPSGDRKAAEAVARRQDMLTKPQGSLGRLEEVVTWLARWQGRETPRLDRVKVIVFAGSHGVTAQGVSAFPPEGTAQMVANFAAGGAAINQLARGAGAELDVIALDVEHATADFTLAPAMDEEEFLEAVGRGYESVEAGTDLLCFGEMGIGNTSAAAAIASALFGGVEQWVGRGTGVDDAGLGRKTAAIEVAMKRHAAILNDPLKAAAAVGGRELAAILGGTLAARHKSVPVLLDGFVCTAAAAPLMKAATHGLDHALAAHVSAEAGHRGLLEAMKMKPLLDLGMRLGEGSGACLAVNILRAALACHTGMASFADAGVSGKA